jgi:dTDP-glucose 4,6-dehydratase
MQNLLVTGGCGFIGSNFINYYFYKNPTINLINIDALYYAADIDNIDKEIQDSSNYIFIKGNITSSDLIDYVLENYKIDIILNFAAQSHVQNSFENSLQYTKDNILGTHVLLECCRKYKKIHKFIHVSTDEVYGESMLDIDEQHKTEHSILCPTNPYAATKACAEFMAQSYIHSYNMPIIITRGNNVYGKNQYPEKLIPLFIKQLKENKKVTIHGDGSCVRAFLHVFDVCMAFELILMKGVIGEVYNIGCDDNMEYSIMDIAKFLIKKIKNTDDFENYIEYVDDRPFNDKRYYISNKKLKDLGWTVTIQFEKGVQDLL